MYVYLFVKAQYSVGKLNVLFMLKIHMAVGTIIMSSIYLYRYTDISYSCCTCVPSSPPSPSSSTRPTESRRRFRLYAPNVTGYNQINNRQTMVIHLKQSVRTWAEGRVPLSIMQSTPFFTSSISQIEGAKRDTKRSYTLPRATKSYKRDR